MHCHLISAPPRKKKSTSDSHIIELTHCTVTVTHSWWERSWWFDYIIDSATQNIHLIQSFVLCGLINVCQVTGIARHSHTDPLISFLFHHSSSALLHVLHNRFSLFFFNISLIWTTSATLWYGVHQPADVCLNINFASEAFDLPVDVGGDFCLSLST